MLDIDAHANSSALKVDNPPARGVVHVLRPDQLGAVYVLVLIVVVFSLWIPSIFISYGTVTQILNNYSITGLVALSLVMPLSCGVFDISGAYTVSFSGVLAAYLIVERGFPVPVAVALALLASLGIGAINAFVVVALDLESLIATLATGSVILSVTIMISGSSSVTDIVLTHGFARIAQTYLFDLGLPVLYLLLVGAALWYVMEHTVMGRQMYAVGFNLDAARLAGVRANRLRATSLLVSSTTAGVAGVVLASRIGSGSPTVGQSYLLPAFAAVFLGATQFRSGRFNSAGTILAVLLLGTGVTGLALAGAPIWSGSLFTGIVLIVALGLTRAQRRRVAAGSTS